MRHTEPYEVPLVAHVSNRSDEEELQGQPGISSLAQDSQHDGGELPNQQMPIPQKILEDSPQPPKPKPKRD